MLEENKILLRLPVILIAGILLVFLFQESASTDKKENLGGLVVKKSIEKAESPKGGKKGKDGEKEERKEGAEIESPFIKEVEDHPEQVVDCKYKVSGVPSPKGVAFRPNSDEFWSTSLMNKNYGVVVFNEFSGERKEEITLPDGGGVEVIFNASGSEAYVSQMETGRVFQIDAETKEVSEVYNAESSWTKVLALSEDEKELYASNWVGNDVSKIDLENKEVHKFPTVATPRGIHLSGRYLYVAGFASGQVQKINLKTGDSKVLIKTGGAMRSIVGGEDYLYVSDMALGAVYRINKETDKVEKFVETDNNPNTIKLAQGNRILVVSNRGINNPISYYRPGPEWGSILFFDTKSGEKLEALVGGNQPTALDVGAGGSKVIYSNFLDGELILCKLPPYEEILKAGGGRVDSYKKDLRK